MGTYKFVMPNSCDQYVKTGTTEFQVISSTGALYHQGTILPNSSLLGPLKVVTWASTIAHTLADTTTTQELINKTINNITITNPTSNAVGTLTIANGGTFAKTGAYALTLETTANSHAYMPPVTAQAARLLWTTEADGKITAKSSQINPLGVVTWPTTAAHTLVSTTSIQTLENKTLGVGSVFAAETATSDSTLVNYGISLVFATTAGGAATVGLAAPAAGTRKVICVTANSSDTVTVDATSDVVIGNSTANSYNKILFQCPAVVELIGVSTAKYMVLSLGSTAYAGTTTLPSLTS